MEEENNTVKVSNLSDDQVKKLMEALEANIDLAYEFKKIRSMQLSGWFINMVTAALAIVVTMRIMGWM